MEGTAILGLDIIGTRGVPGETEEDWAIGTIIVVVILEEVSNGIVDLLVVNGSLGLVSASSDNSRKSRLYKMDQK
jgi:hypothetical protein